MKQIITLVFLALFTCNLIASSPDNDSPVRFPLNQDSEWIEYQGSMVSIQSLGDIIYKYFVKGDTLIENLKYYKLFTYSISYFDKVYYSDTVLKVSIRSDSTSIFIHQKGEKRLLYDFTVKPMDTIKSEINNGGIVSSVEILPDGRRKFYFKKDKIRWTDTTWLYFVEGIGSSGGLFNNSPIGHVGDLVNYLICYSEKGQPKFYSNFTGQDCSMPPPNSINYKEFTNITMYPNPVENFLYIKTNLNFDRVTVALFDLYGRSRFNETIPGREIKLNVKSLHLGKGVYLIKIFINQDCFTRKVFVK